MMKSCAYHLLSWSSQDIYEKAYHLDKKKKGNTELSDRKKIKYGEWTISTKTTRQAQNSNRTRQNNKRRDRKEKLNDTPEISYRKVASDIPALSSGAERKGAEERMKMP